MAYSRFFVTVTVTATVVLLYCSSKISAQDFCGVIGDDSCTQFQVDATKMFYLDVDHPACCSGNITSWRVCYYGPADDDSKRYRVKYAVYRPSVVTESNDTVYHLVSGSNRSTTLCSRDSDKYDQLYTGGFHCYEQFLDTHNYVFVEEGDVVGACVVDPKGKMKQLNIVSKVRQSPDSVQLRGTKQMQYINLCRKDTNNIRKSIMLNQLSVTSSTRLHLSANITTVTMGK